MRARWLFVMIICIICVFGLVFDASSAGMEGKKQIPDDVGTRQRVINKKEQRKGNLVNIVGCRGGNCYDDGTTVTCETCWGRGGMNNWPSINIKKICAPNTVQYDGDKLRCNPQGSFTASCSDISWDANVLRANCRNIKGQGHKTELRNYAECTGELANCDGNIDCINVNLPNIGSYKNSCWCCRMDGATLRCHCNKKGGGEKWTGLDNANNYRDIWNDNGNLKGR